MSITSIKNQLHTNYDYLSTIMRFNSSADDTVYLSICDIIGGFDIHKIHDVIKSDSSFRIANGFSSNQLDYMYSDSQYIGQSQMDVKISFEDLDVPRYVLDKSKNQIMNAIGCLFSLLRQGKQLEAFPFYQGIVLGDWNI